MSFLCLSLCLGVHVCVHLFALHDGETGDQAGGRDHTVHVIAFQQKPLTLKNQPCATPYSQSESLMGKGQAVLILTYRVYPYIRLTHHNYWSYPNSSESFICYTPASRVSPRELYSDHRSHR